MISPLVHLALPTAAAERVQRFGASLREIELLGSLAEDARSGRLHVPLDELERAQVAPESLARPPWPAPLAQLLRQRHLALRAALGEAVEPLGPPGRQALRGLMVWATLACTASRRAQARLPQASSPRDHHAPLDGWRAWRAARRVEHGHQPTLA